MQDVELSSGQLVAMGGTRVQPEIVEARDVARGRRAVDPTLGLVAYYQFLLEEPDEIECDGLWVRSASLNQA